MAMQIETYEIEESTECTPEQDAEAIGLIEKLGLKGQEELVRKTDATTGKRLQYPEMTAQEIAVYRAIFPVKTALKSYSHGIIPVRVLQVAAHAFEFCDGLQVWHKKHRDPDPLLVGYKGHEWSPSKFIRLARWGDALKDFSELVKDARVIIKQQLEIKLRGEIAEAQAKLGQVDDLTERNLMGDASAMSPF
jgi:hypothetical protein